MQTVLIHGDKKDNKGVQTKAKHDDVTSFTEPLSNQVRKGDDETARSEQSSIEEDKVTTNKRDIVGWFIQ